MIKYFKRFTFQIQSSSVFYLSSSKGKWGIQKSISKNFMVGEEDCRRHTPPNKLMKWVSERGQNSSHHVVFWFLNFSRGWWYQLQRGCSLLLPLISFYWAIICSFEKKLHTKGGRQKEGGKMVLSHLSFTYGVQSQLYYLSHTLYLWKNQNIENYLESLLATLFYYSWKSTFPVLRKIDVLILWCIMMWWLSLLIDLRITYERFMWINRSFIMAHLAIGETKRC